MGIWVIPNRRQKRWHLREGKIEQHFYLKASLMYLYVNAERPGDALTASKLLFQCGNCSRVQRLCSPVVSQYCCRARDRALKQTLQKKKVLCSDVRCSNQSKFWEGLCCFKRKVGTVGGKKSGESQRIQVKNSRMKGLNFKKSVWQEILVPLTQLASKYQSLSETSLWTPVTPLLTTEWVETERSLCRKSSPEGDLVWLC